MDEQNGKIEFPTEIIELTSKGLLYPAESALSSGQVEMKYMTAKEEDILTNTSYIRSGIVFDKLMQALLVTKFPYGDLLICDKNTVLISARILGYGPMFKFNHVIDDETKVPLEVDLTKLSEKDLDESLYNKGVNEFEYTLPKSGVSVTFKLLTHNDSKIIAEEIKGLKKINPSESFLITTKLKQQITSVNGDRSVAAIRKFVDSMLSLDAKDLRRYIDEVTPEINLDYKIENETYGTLEGTIPVGDVTFFWPD